MTMLNNSELGYWVQGADPDAQICASALDALRHLTRLVYAVDTGDGAHYAVGGMIGACAGQGLPVLGFSPPCRPENLGDRAFCAVHGISLPYYGGSMAHGIASETMIVALGEAGMLGFFGSAGISLGVLRDIIIRLKQRMSGIPFGFNLINSPGDAAWERGAVSLLLEQGIHLVEASAYVLPTPALVKYRVSGLHQDPQGMIKAANRVIAKVSRSEIARRFMEPPPEKILRKLVDAGEITAEEARLAAHIPLAQDITAEADSGGHTDHRAALTVLPTLQRVRDDVQRVHGYPEPSRIGLAGGIGTPESVAAAFSMGAAYVVTASVNQACVESGTSPMARAMLAKAAQTDVADAPAADMFEQGVKVQVLKRGTRFAERAAKLYDLYRRYDGVDAIPQDDRAKIEKTIFRASLEDVWEQTRAYFEARNPRQLEKAEAEPRHKLALICRWYLGNAVGWANGGVAERSDDFQIWCGPAMGAFNDWTKGTYLEQPENRRVADVAVQLLRGAALLLRVQGLRAQGIDLAADSSWTTPVQKIK